MLWFNIIGIFLCFIFVIIITLEQRKMTNCTGGKIEPQHIYAAFVLVLGVSLTQN